MVSSAPSYAHLRRIQARLQAAFNGRLGRDLDIFCLEMEPPNLAVLPPSPSICPPQAGNPCSRTITRSCCWLLCCVDLGNGHHYSHSRLCPLNPAQMPSVHPLLSFMAFLPTKFFSHHIDMVCHRMRSRRGGTRGGSAHPQAAQSPEPASPSLPHENPPPHSSPHRHYPHTRNGRGRVQSPITEHSDFRLHTATFPLPPILAPYSTQFRFQSNLNRPIITANITTVFSEESEQQGAPLRRSEAQHQEKHSHGISRDSGLLLEEEGKGMQSGGLHAEGGHTKDIWPPGGSSVGASSSMAIAGSKSGTLPARGPQGGIAEEDEDWYRYACRIVEETPALDEPK